ncbi:dexamethasone-induced protein isoform X1 [Nycticebus coucang]|uniref:dexamethasone-induced protein isoform X1 n=1 Tax=Nycticebus coucang TaxID=9470 RepID=UPI00234CB3E6|nr:dexamethasone-induced protein isoform X1 [Nycticebus coucang]
MPPLLVRGTVWMGMEPQDEALPCFRGLLFPLKCFVPTERFLPVPSRVEGEIGTECLSPEKGEAKGNLKTSLACRVPQMAWPWLVTLQPRWVFTGTQPEFASLLFTPNCTCFPHLTFGEDTSSRRHTQKRLPALQDAS